MVTRFLTRVWQKNDQNLSQFSRLKQIIKKISFGAIDMNQPLILTSYTKLTLIHKETMKLQSNY